MGMPQVPTRLATSGPYFICRHPQALGNMLFLIGALGWAMLGWAVLGWAGLGWVLHRHSRRVGSPPRKATVQMDGLVWY